MVSVLTIYSVNPSSNLVQIDIFMEKCVKRMKINEKEPGIGVLFITMIVVSNIEIRNGTTETVSKNRIINS